MELADEEIIVKDYHAATVKKPTYGEAHVAVTTKRVIMYIWTKKTTQVNGVDIVDVLGTDIFWSKRQRRPLGFALLIIGVFICAIPFLFNPFLLGILPPAIIFGSILIALGIYYIVRIGSSFAIVINIQAATGALSFYSYKKDTWHAAPKPERIELDGTPGPDAIIMSKELGALILNMRKVER